MAKHAARVTQTHQCGWCQARVHHSPREHEAALQAHGARTDPGGTDTPDLVGSTPTRATGPGDQRPANTEDAMPDFTKLGSGLTALEISMEFSQRTGGGWGGKLARRFNPSDPDLVAGVGAGNLLVDLIDPKDKPSGFSGAITHRGDAKGDGSEVIAIDLTRLHAEDSDIDAFVLGAFCKGDQGFGRVAGIVWRIYDTSAVATGSTEVTPGRRHLGNVRIDISSTDSSVAAAVLRRVGPHPVGTWQYAINPRFGRATSVAGLGNVFRPALGG